MLPSSVFAAAGNAPLVGLQSYRNPPDADNAPIFCHQSAAAQAIVAARGVLDDRQKKACRRCAPPSY